MKRNIILALIAVILLVNMPPEIIVVLVILITALGIYLYKYINSYFESEEFYELKNKTQSFINDNNKLARYANELTENPELQLGVSQSGKYAHHADYENTSIWNYNKEIYDRHLSNDLVHNCSLGIVDRARNDPTTYVMKYFQLKPNEDNLKKVEKYGEMMERMNAAIENLKERHEDIADHEEIPNLIKILASERLMEELHVTPIPIVVEYPTYTFQYVSPGGKSSDAVRIDVTPDFIDDLIFEMSEKVKFRKSAAGQRALMTSKLRNDIKERDDYTCQKCNISIYDEPHLLLEIDHIQPISRGGLTSVDNLQTLCWMCNRRKGAKLE